jgi:hypothetical protein
MKRRCNSRLYHIDKKPRLSLFLADDDDEVEDDEAMDDDDVDDEAIIDLVCKSHQPQSRTRAVVASLQLPTSIATQVASVFGDDLFVAQPPPLPAFDTNSDELKSPSPSRVNSGATQLRRALIRQRLQVSPAGKRRAELVHKYADLAARAHHFDRSLAEKLAERVKQWRQRQVDAVAVAAPLRSSLDASERLARRIVQREFEESADYAQVWNSGNTNIGVVANNNSVSFSSPPLLATPTVPSVPPTGDWFTPNGPIGQHKPSTAAKRLQFHD